MCAVGGAGMSKHRERAREGERERVRKGRTERASEIQTHKHKGHMSDTKCIYIIVIFIASKCITESAKFHSHARLICAHRG